MINPFPIEDPDLDSAITAAHSDMRQHSADTKEFAAAVDQLTKLYALRNGNLQSYQDAQEFELKYLLDADAAADVREAAEKPFYKRVSPDTALTIAANIFIGLAVIKYEQTGVIRTEVRNFLIKKI